jgi:hypothetical protein
LLIIALAKAAESTAERHGESRADGRDRSLGSLLRSQIARRRCEGSKMTRDAVRKRRPIALKDHERAQTLELMKE